MKIEFNCPICGRAFNPCKTSITKTGVFNWREVVCSFECGQKYLQQIEEKEKPQNAQEFVNIVANDVESLSDEIDNTVESTVQISKAKAKSKTKQ